MAVSDVWLTPTPRRESRLWRVSSSAIVLLVSVCGKVILSEYFMFYFNLKIIVTIYSFQYGTCVSNMNFPNEYYFIFRYCFIFRPQQNLYIPERGF